MVGGVLIQWKEREKKVVHNEVKGTRLIDYCIVLSKDYKARFFYLNSRKIILEKLIYS